MDKYKGLREIIYGKENKGRKRNYMIIGHSTVVDPQRREYQNLKKKYKKLSWKEK